MDELKLYNGNIIMSENGEIIKSDVATHFCEELILNGKNDTRISKTSFYNIEPCCEQFKDIVEVLRQEYLSNALEVHVNDATILTDDFITFCKKNSVSTVLNIEDFDIKNIPEVNECNLIITEDNITKLSTIFKTINSKQIKYISLSAKPEANIQVKDLTPQFDKVFTEIKKTFEKDKVPTVITNILPLLFGVVKNNTAEDVAKQFDYEYMLDMFQADIKNCVTLMPDARVFFGNLTKDAKNVKLLIGRYSDYLFMDLDKKVKALKDELFTEEEPKALKFSCKSCAAYSGCYAGNWAMNFLNNNHVNTPDANFCKISRELMKQLARILPELDKAQNKTFKDFLFRLYQVEFRK